MAKNRKKKTDPAQQSKPLVVVECPPELGPVARQEWERVVPHLIAADRIEASDRALLAVYCAAFANWLDATTTIQTYGAIIKSPNGHAVQSPAVSIANQNADLMVRIAVQFGFTPASRGRLPKSKDSPAWMLDYKEIDLDAGLKPLDIE